MTTPFICEYESVQSLRFSCFAYLYERKQTSWRSSSF